MSTDRDSVVPPGGENDPEQRVISALFSNTEAAEAAVRELLELDVAPADISLITRNEDEQGQSKGPGPAGVAREDLGDQGLTYRASEELPNDEDLPTTEAAMTGEPVLMPTVTDYEVPSDEPLGGGERLGLSRDEDLVRRNEAETNADEDIYTDYPNRPGGFNPESPAAQRAGADVQETTRARNRPAGDAAVGAGLGGLSGLLIGMAALAVPGVGPLIAAGPLAGALSAIIAGSAAGGIIGALAGVGVPPEFAREYAASIKQGQTLLSVRTAPDTYDAVERVMTVHGGENIR